MRLLKKIKRLSYDFPLLVVGFCAGVMILVLAAVFISSGGIGSLNRLLAVNNVGPGSQLADSVPVGVYSFAANPQYVAPGGYTTLSWLANYADNCYVWGPGANAYYASGSGNYSISVGPVNSTSQYSVQCYNYGPYNSGTSWVLNTTVTVPSPTTISSFTASPNPVVSGNPTTLSWTGSAGAGFNNCNVYGGDLGGGSWTYPMPGSKTTAPLTANTTYGLQCTDQAYGTIGPVYTSVTVTGPSTSADLTSNSPRVAGQSATLSFYADSSVAPTQCQIKNYDDTVVLADVAGCSSAQARTYTTPLYADSGLYSYKFYYFQGGVWTLAKTLTVAVNSLAPVPSISANPTTVAIGATSALSWSATDLSAGKQCTLTSVPGSNSPNATNFGAITSGTANGNYSADVFTGGGYVYMMGGYLASGARTGAITRAAVGSDLTNAANWSSVGTMPAAAGSESQPLVINGIVYVFGGYTAAGTFSNSICRALLTNIAGGWTCPGSLPAGSAQYDSDPVIIGNYIYRIGGWTGNVGPSRSVLRAPVSNPLSWTTFTNILPAAVAGMPVVVVGNHVYVFGGWNGGTFNTNIYRASVTSDITAAASWSTIANAMPYSGYNETAAVDTTNLYLIGGWTAGAGGNINSILKMPLTTLASGSFTAATWTSAGTLPAVYGYATTLLMDNKLYTMGGFSNGYTGKILAMPFYSGLPYTTPSIQPWRTDGAINAAVTWPIAANTTYTLQCTNAVGTNSASVTVGPTDYCTNAPFNGFQSSMPANATAVGTTCTCNSGYVWNGSACAIGTTPPTMSITPVDPNSGALVRRVRKGGSMYLNWSVSGLPMGDPATSCSVFSSPAGGMTTQTWDRSSSMWTQASSPIPAITINNPTTFTVSCTNAGWTPSTVSASAFVGLVPAFQEQ